MKFERLYSGFLFLVAAVSFLAVALHWGGVFDPRLALIFGLLLGGGGWWWACARSDESLRSAVRSTGTPWLVFGLVLLSLGFRPEPNRWISGGQDPGVYTNMGAFLQDHPSTNHRLPVFAGTTDSATVAAWTRRAALHVDEDFLPGQYEGSMLPGVYLADVDEGEGVFQFYHLLPLWMAIFGEVAGREMGVWAVLFFGVLTIVNAFLLIREVSGSRLAALVGAGLLAINPLHAHFSRVPVSETLALFFSTAGLWWLARAYGQATLGTAARRLALGCAAAFFGLYCFTRISGFMYLPLLWGGAVMILCLEAEKGRRRDALTALGVAGGIYVASVLYGWQTSFPYCHDQYAATFAPFLGDHWGLWLTVLGVAMMGALVGLARWRQGRLWAAQGLSRLDLLLGGLLLCLVAVHVWRVFLLATGQDYAEVDFVARFGLFGQGWRSVQASSLFLWVLYLGPAIVVGFLYTVFSRRNRSAAKHFGLLLVAGFFGFAALFQWVIPYQYYYSRYLLSEVLPFSLLFTAMFWPPLRGWGGRIGAALLVALGAAGALSFSSAQWHFKGENSFAADLGKLVAPVDSGDLLVLLREDPALTRLQLPLQYYFARRVLVVPRADLEALVDSDLGASFPDLWLLSSGSIANATAWEVRDEARFVRREARRDTWPQREEVAHPFRLSLRRWHAVPLPADPGLMIWQRGKPGRSGAATGLHADRTWTKGEARVEFEAKLGTATRLVVRLNGWIPAAVPFASMKIEAALNGVRLPEVSRERTRLVFSLPPGAWREGDNVLELDSDVFVPAEVVDSTDRRELGLDLVSIGLEGEETGD